MDKTRNDASSDQDSPPPRHPGDCPPVSGPPESGDTPPNPGTAESGDTPPGKETGLKIGKYTSNEVGKWIAESTTTIR